MNNMVTAETVSPGHPDKIADLISDYVLTQALKNNRCLQGCCRNIPNRYEKWRISSCRRGNK